MENNEYLTKQIITYIGNKRKLLTNIDETICEIKTKLGKDKLTICDMFSGSGIVARLFKQHAEHLMVNDLELYSSIINKCYLTNQNDIDLNRLETYFNTITNRLNDGFMSGVITENYAPKDEANITENDRVFYTIRNAKYIDTCRTLIDEVVDDPSYKALFIGPLLSEASIHTNTSGVFKGFYKSKDTKCGKFGGDGANALSRICGDISLQMPVLSDHNCKVSIYNEDANELVKRLGHCDVVYLDPPYNQHPYGSNYFMLNVICNNKITGELSKVSGIPNDWKKSSYNNKNDIHNTFETLINDIDAKYIVISYNNEGFLTKNEFISILSKYGKLTIKEIPYTVYRGGRNVSQRQNPKVIEYLYILEKKN